MARNEHKKVLRQLSEAYQNVQEGLFNYRVQEDDGSWPIDEREAERRKNPDYGEPEEDGGYMGEDEDAEDTFKVGDWVYDDEGAHASIVDIDGDEVALYDGKEGWTTHISEIKPEGAGEGLYPKSLGGGGSITSSQKFLGDEDNEEGELSDDWEKPNYRGDQHDFQPGEIVEVGPWGPNDEADHLEVVLQIKGDVVNTIPITDDAYGVQYGGRGGADIELIRPQSDSYFDHGDFKPADGREW